MKCMKDKDSFLPNAKDDNDLCIPSCVLDDELDKPYTITKESENNMDEVIVEFDYKGFKK